MKNNIGNILFILFLFLCLALPISAMVLLMINHDSLEKLGSQVMVFINISLFCISFVFVLICLSIWAMILKTKNEWETKEERLEKELIRKTRKLKQLKFNAEIIERWLEEHDKEKED